MQKTCCKQIIEKSKMISKNKPIYKNILKSLYPDDSHFYFRVDTFFFLLRNDVTKGAIGIH